MLATPPSASAIDPTLSKSGEDFSIETCTQEHAKALFTEWSFKEQWNPGTKGQELDKVFYKVDPTMFFYGKVTRPTLQADGTSHQETKVVSIVSAMRYGKDQAWIGFYIVDPAERGKNYGLRTFRHALVHAAEAENRNGVARPSIGLDAVMAQVENYKKSGFTAIGWQNERRHGSSLEEFLKIDPSSSATTPKEVQAVVAQVKAGTSPGLIDLNHASKAVYGQLGAMETLYAGLDRAVFIEEWVRFIAEHPEQRRFACAVVSTDGQEKVLGYGCIRPAVSSYRVGPLYATSVEVAKQILVKLAHDVVEAEKKEETSFGVPLEIDVDCPNSNKAAVELFDSLGWNDTFLSLRMWKGTAPKVQVDGVFGVATLEVG